MSQSNPEIIHDTIEELESPEDRSWAEHALKMHQSAPEHLENTAKFLGALVSICFTLLVRIHQSKLTEAATEGGMSVWTFSAIALWLGCIAFCFFVFFPFDYSYSTDAPDTIKDAHQKIVATKRGFLKWATGMFLLGCLALAAGMVV